MYTCTGNFCISAKGRVASNAVTSFTFLSKFIISEWLSKNLPMTIFSRILPMTTMFSCSSAHTRACKGRRGAGRGAGIDGGADVAGEENRWDEIDPPGRNCDSQLERLDVGLMHQYPFW